MKNIENEIRNYYMNPESLWDNLPEPVIHKLRTHLTILKYKKNDIIYREGTFPKGLYILKSGIAKVQLINNAGKEQIIYILKKNELFGYRSLAAKNTSLIFITALEPCEIEIINKDIYQEVLLESKEMVTYFFNLFGNETRVLFHKISYFSQKPVNERIALTLLIMGQKFHDTKKQKKEVGFSKKDIASFTGTIVETVSRQLKKLAESQIIRTKGRKIIIEDEVKLFEIANI